MRWPNEELLLAVEQAVKSEPGAWTARLCRHLNGCDETKAGVQHCGRCIEYANTRKRARAEHWQQQPLLPGFDEAPFQLHPPCTTIGFRKLRYLLDVLWSECDLIYGVPLSPIPDLCQPRGWDLATRFYPAE